MRAIIFVTLALISLLPEWAKGAAISTSDRILARAFTQQRSEFRIRFMATVVAKLPMDKEGIRHQKFLVELSTGQTLLVAHNIDLAPRIKRLRKNRPIRIFGEYIWSDEGGIIHFTHHDPDGDDPDGWIKFDGVKYQ